MFLFAMWYWLLLLALSSSVVADLLSKIETAFANAVDCTSGQALLRPLQQLAHLGDSKFVDILVKVCQDFKVSCFVIPLCHHQD
jgi:hypothetical protein